MASNRNKTPNYNREIDDRISISLHDTLITPSKTIVGAINDAYSKSSDTTIYTLSADNLKTFSSTVGDSDFFKIFSNTNWKIIAKPLWLTVTPLSGSNNADITVTVSGNTGAQRTGIITISGNSVTQNTTVNVLQLSGATPTTILYSDSFNILSSAATSNDFIYVTSNTTWRVISKPSWITLDKQQYSGNTTLRATATGNSSTISRTEYIVLGASGISNYSIGITQLGRIVDSISATTPLLFGTNINNTQQFVINSNTAWVITSVPFWLTLSPMSGTTTTTVTGTVIANSIVPERFQDITITGTGVTPITVRMTQASGFVPSLVTTSLSNFPATGTYSASFNIISNLNWTISSNPLWGVPATLSGLGNTTIYVNKTADNATGADILSSIIVQSTGVVPVLSSTVSIRQLAGSIPTPTLSLGTFKNLAPVGDSGILVVTSNTTWNIVGPPWLVITPSSGSNVGNITITPQNNTGSATKSGFVTVTTPTLTQSITIYQLGAGSNIANYYVAPTTATPAGNDSNAGTIDAPFATLTKAYSLMTGGQLCYVRGGVYTITSDYGGIILFGRSGSAGNLIKIWNYPGELPIFEKASTYECNWGLAIQSANYIHLKGFEIRNFAQGPAHHLPSGIHGHWGWSGVNKGSSNCIFENINSHHNAIGATVDGIDNYFLNCDFHSNNNPYSGWGDGDGLEVYPDTQFSETGLTVVEGCRAWYNSDDGFDSSDNNSAVKFINCWSFKNGYQADNATAGGDGNGFKTGWMKSINYPSTTKRELYNCISAVNRHNAFTKSVASGWQSGKHIMYNNTSYNNGSSSTNIAYNLNWSTTDYDIVRNNISYNDIGYDTSFTINTVQNTNSWNRTALTNGDFISLDWMALMTSRQPDGSLPSINSFHLAPTSSYVGAAVDLGYGLNIGAFSTIVTSGVTSTTLTAPIMGSVDITSATSLTINVTGDSTNATNLKLEQQIGSGAWTTISSTLSKTITSYLVSTLTTGTVYSYRWSYIGNGTTYLNSPVSSVGFNTPSVAATISLPDTASNTSGSIINKKMLYSATTANSNGIDIINKNAIIEGNLMVFNFTNNFEPITINSATTAKTVSIKNNVITVNNPIAHSIVVGSEGTTVYDGKYDGAIFEGNFLTGAGTTNTGGNHGLFMGFNKNAIMKFNKITGIPCSTIYKAKNVTDTTGVTMYNVIRNFNTSGVGVYAINDAKIYNNTFYMDGTVSYADAIHFGLSDTGGTPAMNVDIRNNVFYSTGTQWIAIGADESNIGVAPVDLATLTCDYNIYYRVGGDLSFVIYDGIGTTPHYYSFAQWKALFNNRFDQHSQVIDPLLDPTTLVPAAALNYGTNLGEAYSVGISPTNTWNRTATQVASQSTGSVWQCGAFIR